jgi:hypothetical protein
MGLVENLVHEPIRVLATSMLPVGAPILVITE